MKNPTLVDIPFRIYMENDGVQDPVSCVEYFQRNPLSIPKNPKEYTFFPSNGVCHAHCSTIVYVRVLNEKSIIHKKKNSNKLC